MKRYFPRDIEPYWQKVWQEKGINKFKKESKEKKYYNLVELPYPSGDLHMGHWFSFVPADAHARYKRMNGFNVFFPNGFDAFGLPAENAAIKRGVHPKDWTMKNIENMTKQFATMGTMIDWDYTAITCLSGYYRWNQWIFLKMFEKGIAYKGKALSNWCPVDQTVLANEHIEGGKCWRCGSEVIQKEVEQWFLKITDYADRLIWKEDTRGSRSSDDARRASSQSSKISRSLSESLSSSSSNKDVTAFDSPQSETSRLQNQESVISNQKSDIDWPKEVREGQNNWIGKSEGMLIQFPIVRDSVVSRHPRFSDDARSSSPKKLSQTRSLSESLSPDLAEKQSNADAAFDSPQTGLPPFDVNHQSCIEVFTTRPETADGATFLVISPEHEFVASLLNGKWQMANGKLKEIQEYVERAKRKTEMERKEDRSKSGIFTGKYVKNPVTGKDIPVWISDYVLAGYGTGAIMAVPFADERDREFAQKFNLPIVETSFKAKPGGKKTVNYHLRDWSISRQRYWGTPVPIIYCRKCWEKSKIKNQKSKFEYGRDFIEIDGEKYAMVPVPLEDLPVELPYNVDYTPKGKPPLATDEEWLNVKCPKCGGKAKRDAETLDTFFDSAWYYYRYVSPQYKKAPFEEKEVRELMPVDVYFGGAEHTLGHTLYARFFTKFFKDLGLVSFDEFAAKRVQHGVILGPDGNRMSKSKGNVVNPDEVVKEYGTDTVRLYLCFMMPYEATAPWSTTAIAGVYRFLKRVWEIQSKIKNQKSKIKSDLSGEDLLQMHKTIKKVGDDLENFHFNTAVAALMTWLNYLSAKKFVCQEEYETLLKLLAPFAPHITEELWHSTELAARQSRFSDDARQAQSQPSKQTRSLSESLSSKSESKDVTAFDSPKSELPPSDISRSSRANNLTIQQLNNFKSIHLQPWPKFDPKYLVEEEVSIVVQVNGKVRDAIRVQSSEFKVQSNVEEIAKSSEKANKYLEGKKIIKVIYVEGKILNFVTN
ncbi:MAG: leucine--tRNA ligase [Patescibacteria group bacterium]|nr:leucine--tRNA ligase [Patescibacteria group bacterium]